MSNHTGKLYIVATPIGNLDDISIRAINVLKEVDVIAAEDTRHSKTLLQHFAINTPLRAYHDFNERQAQQGFIELLQQGQTVALISDAGTPLINDPGYRLVKAAHEHAIQVIPVPGPSALICALSAAGLPTDKFIFEGYAPEKQAARKKRFQSLNNETRTLIFYETPHRILDFLQDAVDIFGPSRPVTLAREMTKHFETIRQASLRDLLDWVNADAQQQKGEFVVILQGENADNQGSDAESERVLSMLMQELPLKQAAALAAKITGRKKNELYQLGLQASEDKS